MCANVKFRDKVRGKCPCKLSPAQALTGTVGEVERTRDLPEKVVESNKLNHEFHIIPNGREFPQGTKDTTRIGRIVGQPRSAVRGGAAMPSRDGGLAQRDGRRTPAGHTIIRGARPTPIKSQRAFGGAASASGTFTTGGNTECT